MYVSECVLMCVRARACVSVCKYVRVGVCMSQGFIQTMGALGALGFPPFPKKISPNCNSTEN